MNEIKITELYNINCISLLKKFNRIVLEYVVWINVKKYCNKVECFWTKNGEKYGPFISYYIENNNIRLKCVLYNNLLNGPFISFYENGDIMRQCNYILGCIHGVEIEYIGSNRLKVERYYNMGIAQPESLFTLLRDIQEEYCLIM